MPVLAITKTYNDGQILNASDLDNAYDSISTFLNVTKLDSDNLQANAITTTQITANSVTTAKIADNQVTLAKLAAEVSAFLVPTGTIHAYGHTAAPTGFLLCDGTAVNRVTYAALFAIIGTKFGSGDGATTFHLPDFRGRFLRGWDDGIGRDPDRASRTAMNAGGNSADNIGSIQSYQYQSHTHTGTTSTDGNHSHGAANSGGYIGVQSVSMTPAGPAAQSYIGNHEALTTTTNGNHSHTFTSNANGGNETRPINAFVQYIIKT